MKNSRLMIIFILFLTLTMAVPFPVASDDHKHEEGKGHDYGKVEKKELNAKHEEHGDDDGFDHGEGDGHKKEPIELTEESQFLGGIQTLKVTKSSYASKIPVSGRIAQDVEDVKYVFAPESANVQECKASLGSNVEKDDVLCVVTLNINGETFEIKSPLFGVVISEFIKNGEHVDEATALYAIANMTKLWANFDIYEKDVASIKLGQKMLVYPLSYSDKAFDGEIVFISPRVDESTYTVKIRANVDNMNLLLKLGMSVRGEILVEGNGSTITVPSEAIQTVEGKTVVFKKAKEGFEPQEIKVHSQTKEAAAVQSGLSEGDEIVVKGSFILKSKMLDAEMGHDHAH